MVWVWPDQFPAEEMPNGFALRVDRFLGTADPRRWGADRVWVCGSVFDPAVGRFRDEQITMVISQLQPLAHWRQPPVERRQLVVGGRVFERRY